MLNCGAEGYALDRFLLVGLGGFFGSIARYWVGAYVGGKLGARFPYGTFVVNMSGCLLIGAVIAVLDQRTHWSASLRYLVPIGFIGAYTTFSAFEFETLRSVQQGALATALLNVFLSVALGFAAVWLGATAANAALKLGRDRAVLFEPGRHEESEVFTSSAENVLPQEFAAEPES